LFGLGDNRYLQLGIDNEDRGFSTFKPIEIPFFRGIEIFDIHCGGYFSLVLSSKGLFSFGDNEVGQLGIGSQEKRISAPTQILFFQNLEIHKIACGVMHCLVHCSKGLFSFGSNGCGQLGLNSHENQNLPRQIDFFTREFKILDIFCSFSSSFAITSSGFYSWGVNSMNWLAIEEKRNYNCASHPTQIPELEKEIISFACNSGQGLGLCLTKNGFYHWGQDISGSPKKFEFLKDKKIICIGGCGGAFYCLTTDSFYSWGRNYFGQLGYGIDQDRQKEPKEIPFFSQMTKSFHNLRPFGIEHIQIKKEKLLFLCLLREHCPDSLFGDDYLPLDMLKIIAREAKLF